MTEPFNHNKPWTDGEEGRLVAYYEMGHALPLIAATFGRTCAAVVTRMVRLDLLYEHNKAYYPVTKPFVTFEEIKEYDK